MKRFKYRPLTALLTFGAISGVGTSVGSVNEAYAADTPTVGLSQQALVDLEDLAKQCGFACPGDTDEDGIKIKTLVEGNASVSGIPSIDGFFSSVLNFQVAAKSVAGGINAELEGIRADFDLGAGDDIGALLDAKLKASLEGGFTLKVEPAKCKADIKAEIDAAARCDAKVDPGKVSVECTGGCDVDVKVPMCSAEAELRCTVQAPEVKCEGECTGTCNVELSAAAACNGTCHGECSGECSAYVKNASGDAECAGSCSGMCKGSCDIDVSADASCSGKCRGECTVTKEASAGCEGGLRAQCRGKAGAAIKCDTKCDGEFEPPEVDVKCKAKVHADAKLNVKCTPPRVAFNYRLKASAFADLKARLRFEAALKGLIDVRLPALKVAVERSKLVREAGADLATAATGALKGAVAEAKGKAGVDVKFVFGLGCAAEQLESVKTIIDDSTKALSSSLTAAGKIEAALKI